MCVRVGLVGERGREERLWREGRKERGDSVRERRMRREERGERERERES
jgi:hypothetical protein